MKLITHKMIIDRKVPAGYSPFQIACGTPGEMQLMADAWKNVDCKRCLALKPRAAGENRVLGEARRPAKKGRVSASRAGGARGTR